MGLPWWLSDKESVCQCRRCKLDPWVTKILWTGKRPPTPVFLPGKSPRQRSLASYSPWGHKRVGHDLVTKQQQQSRITGKKNFPTSAIPAGRSGPGPPVCPPQSTEGQPHLQCFQDVKAERPDFSHESGWRSGQGMDVFGVGGCLSKKFR